MARAGTLKTVKTHKPAMIIHTHTFPVWLADLLRPTVNPMKKPENLAFI